MTREAGTDIVLGKKPTADRNHNVGSKPACSLDLN